MRPKPHFVNIIRRWSILLLLTFAAVILASRTIIYLRETESRTREMRATYFETQRQLIKTEVMKFSAVLEYEIAKMTGEADMHERIMHYVNIQRFGPNACGYVFVNELLDIRGGQNFARVYANPNRPDDSGKMLSDDYLDARGKPFRKEFLKGLRESGECYVDYWYKKIDHAEPRPKTSFFKLAGNDRFIVAAGVYLDDVEDEIRLMQADLTARLQHSYLVITLICIGFFIIVLTITGWLTKKLGSDFRIFSEFFKRAADSSIPIDRDTVKFSELDLLAASANTMLSQKARADEALLETRDRLTEAQKMAKLGHYIFDVKHDSWTNSPELDAIFGIDDHYDKTASGWLAIVHPDFRDAMSAYLRDDVSGRHPKFDMEYKIIHQETGQERWVHGLGDLTFDKENRLTEMFGTIQDITGLKVAYNALKESEERFRLAFRTIPDAICLNRASDGMYIDINQGFTDLTGYTRHDVLGKSSLDISIWKDADDRKQLTDALAKTGYVKNFEARFVRKNGDIGIGLMSARTLSIDDEAVIQAITKDITEFRRAEDKRKKLETQLQQTQKMEAIGTLAGGIAHDFNNILSGILGYSQLALLDVKHPESVSKRIDQIIKSAHRAADLTKQILTFSRQGSYEKQPFRIALEIKEALKLLRSSIPSTIGINTRIDSRKKVLADPIKIHQVIMNLCTNAYHAMRKTGGDMAVSLKDVVIHASRPFKDKDMPPGDYIRLDVIDTGHGMDAETLEKIFEPYFTTKETGDGTGLGLALVQAIVEEHDGFLEVESEPGKGTRVSLFFPVVGGAAEEKIPEPEAGAHLAGTETIMFVDDEKAIRESCRIYLETKGYQVRAFSSGIDALETFKTRPLEYDLIITDMNMPGFSGDKLAKEILNIKPDIPIVLCTGFSENISHSEALALGIRRFIQKPVVGQNLLRLIRGILDEK